MNTRIDLSGKKFDFATPMYMPSDVTKSVLLKVLQNLYVLVISHFIKTEAISDFECSPE